MAYRSLIALIAALALAACSSVEAPVEAPPPSKTGALCGGVAGVQCKDQADYCSTPKGQCVEVADLAGVCRKKPEVCTMDYTPVCGCDGKTYSNACMAAGAGASVAHDGECVEGS